MAFHSLAQRLVLIVCLGFVRPGDAAPVDEATAAIASLQAALVETAQLEPDPGLDARYERLAPVVAATHDLATMARLTVRRHWREWSEADRERFTAAFGRLSITTYAVRFASVGPESFAIVGGTEEGADRVAVQALVRRADADDVPLDYLLQQSDGQWRIINVFADGASELSLMAAEFHAIAESDGIDGLLAEIDTRIAALRG